MNKLRRFIPSKKRLYIALWFTVIVFLGSLIYTKFGGDWASSTVIKTPNDAVEISTYTESSFDFRYRHTLYVSNNTSLDVRDWYAKDIAMSPTDNQVNDEYCSLYQSIDTTLEYNMLYVTALISLNPNIFRDVTGASCFTVCVADVDSISGFEFGESVVNTNDAKSVITTQSCWPNW